MRKRFAVFVAMLGMMLSAVVLAPSADAAFDGYIVKKTNVYNYEGARIGTLDVAMGWSNTGGCHVLADGGGSQFPDGIRIHNRTSLVMNVLSVDYRRIVAPSPGAALLLSRSEEALYGPITILPNGYVTVHTGSQHWTNFPPTFPMPCDQAVYIETKANYSSGAYTELNKNYSPTGLGT
jgi:hypothetical protein